MNFLLGWLFVFGGAHDRRAAGACDQGVEAGSPAAQAGIMTGDVVKNFTTAQSFIGFINAHRGQATTIAVIRNNKEIDFNARPARDRPAPNEGAIGVALRRGRATARRILCGPAGRLH